MNQNAVHTEMLKSRLWDHDSSYLTVNTVNTDLHDKEKYVWQEETGTYSHPPKPEEGPTLKAQI